MNFLLKIVQGPNAGAEVALVEGVAVSVGRADNCDIVLADGSLPDVAFRLEPGADGVVLSGDGIASERLEPLSVKTFGSTSFAVGPADAPWGPLKWPEAKPAEPAAETAPPPADAPAEPAGEAPENKPGPEGERRRRGRWLGCLVAVLLLAVLLAALLWLFRDRVAAYRAALAERRGGGGDSAESAENLAAAVRPLDWLVSEYPGLSVAEKDGKTVVAGNFETRAQRLAATAALYQRNPGVSLELTDNQSMRTAAEDTLGLLSFSALKVVEVTNRVVVLSGTAASASELRGAIEALDGDIRHLAGVDTSQVELLAPSVDAAPAPAATLPAPTRRQGASASRPATPSLPVCGIVTTPYPCLVLRDGRRVLEGATWGENHILKIEADEVTVTNSAGRFTWRP